MLDGLLGMIFDTAATLQTQTLQTQHNNNNTKQQHNTTQKQQNTW